MMDGMDHVEPGELAGFVYGELEGERRAAVERHLAACGECREEVARWEAVRGELRRWRLAERPVVRRPVWRGAWKAAAAVGLVVAGFGAARLTAPRGVSAEEVRAEIRAEVGKDVARQQAEREGFEGAVTQALAVMEARRASDAAALRRDIETVAVRTQAAFEQIVAAPAP